MRTLLALPALLLFSSCFMDMNRVSGNGVSTTQARSVSGFDRVEVTGDFDVELSPGSASVRVMADENLQQYIEVVNSGNRLTIHHRDGYSLHSKTPVKIYVSAPSYASLEMTGSGDVHTTGRLTGNNFDIDLTGSGDARLDLDMPQVKAQVTGSGSIQLSGTTRRFEAEINGSGGIQAFGLMAETTKVEVAGSGDAEVFASKKLDIEVAGSGNVSYKGTAAVNQSVHGSGDVHKAD